MSAVAPPPPVAPSSTITVAPSQLYNLGGRKPISSTAPSGSSASKPAKAVAKAEPKAAPAKPAVKETVASAPEPAPAAVEPAAPAAAPAAYDDPALLARPVRKGEPAADADGGTPSPQSSATPSAGSLGGDSKAVDVIPVSAPGTAVQLDGRFSS